jgi:protocatechuate 3,4-dioxygenase, beta subunit
LSFFEDATMTLSRRDAMIGAATIAAFAPAHETLAQTATPTQLPKALTPTPRDAEGPFYPTSWSGEIDGDLIALNGKRYDAGTSLLLLGRVLSTSGDPITDATVEIWQVDATGKYRHPRDDGDGPLKRGFQGFGRVVSDDKGAYRFRTIKPVNYGGRPAHIHFRVAAKGYRELTTQMYFSGENEEKSGFGGFSRERERLTVKTQPLRDASAGAALATHFDIVLAKA